MFVNIAIIPARSGSKGLIDKNIKQLNNKPLMAYTIEAAIKSSVFDLIIVSTDSPQYAEIAKSYGAVVPFLRSPETSSDSASSWDVVKEVLNKLKIEGIEFQTITLLQPTSPLRDYEDIIRGHELLVIKNANAIVSVCETEHSPLWCNTLPEDHSLEKFVNRDALNQPRQFLPCYYRINGAIYILKVEYLMNNENIFSSSCYALIMEKAKSIDIDDEIDFKIAELLMTSLE